MEFRVSLIAAIVVALFTSTSFLTNQLSSEREAVGTPARVADEKGAHAFDSVGSFFTQNKGQVSEPVRYYSTGNPSVAFRDDGVMFVARLAGEGDARKGIEESEPQPDFPVRSAFEERHVAESFAYLLRFDGSNHVSPVGVNRLSFNSNLFIGNDSNKWRTDVPNYEEVVYHDLYDGIDLVYHMGKTGLKYELAVNPGADPEAMTMSYEGIESLQADAAGLSIHTPLGEMRDSAPLAYQGPGQLVDCGFVRRGAFSYGFSCGDWDRSRPLIIDPLLYATFIGGSNLDGAWQAVVDETGDAYVMGGTYSVDFPVTPGALFRSLGGSEDAFVAKLDATGSALLYATYLGGTTGYDSAYSIAVDSSGCAYVTGNTRSLDFPTTPGAFDRTSNSQDAFVVKLNTTGNALEYSTFLGGSLDDGGLGIAVDKDGRAFVTGYTDSEDFPMTADAWDATLNGYVDAFVAKLNPLGSGIEYATFIGGAESENARSIALDASADMYITGWTMSTDFPVTSGAFDVTYNDGQKDALVVKLNSTGELAYATFLGGSGLDEGFSVTVDSFGNAYVTGNTNSTDFPVTPGAFDTSYNGGWDSFVAKLNAAGCALVFATFLGGSGDDVGFGVALDDAGNAYVGGSTASVSFPITAGAIDTSLNGSYDVFLSVLTPAGDALVYSTYLGGDDSDGGASVALDAAGAVYLAGETESHDFPVTPGAFDMNLKGPDGFVAKLTLPLPPGVADLAVFPSDIVLSPLPPYEDDTTVQLNATIRNIGGNYTKSTSARFEDGVPPSPRIGAERPLPPIPAGGGWNVSVTWTAFPEGVHQICVVADPDNIVAETDETNNIACVPAEVLSPPDLVPVNLGVIPSSHLQDMTVAQVNVTVRNDGGLPAGGFDALFFDDLNANGMPDGGESIGSFPISGLVGHSQANVSVQWTATPLGGHRICAYTDPPPGTVTESNETNNVMCIDVLVQPGPILRPDYVPVSPLPLPPVKVGMSSRVDLSIQIYNQGNGTATDDATVAFSEQSSPPFSTFVLTPLAPAATSSRFTATWISPAIPGTYLVSVDVDYYDNVTEWDETNNVYTWTIEVVAGPVTSMVVGGPNCTSPAMVTYVKSVTPLDLFVLDQSGLGIRNTTYRIDGGVPINYTATGTFFLAGEGEHNVNWRSLDWAGNLEDVSSRMLRVDDTAPATILSIGDPKYLVGGNFVTSFTPLTLMAVDGGVTPVGLDLTEYRLDGGNWKTYSSSFSLAGEGAHILEYRSRDLLGNTEAIQSMPMVVDDTPPATAISIGEPKYLTGGNFVKSSTPLALSAADGGVGSNSTFYRLWDDSWSQWGDYSTSYNLAGRNGTWYVEFLSFDYLGNTEAVRNETLILDDTPPATTISSSAPFTLTAADEGCGVNVMMYRIDGGSWTVYTGGFTLPEGEHTIYYHSVDNLGNVEQERSLAVKPAIEVEVIYKPIVALMFAIVLLVAGVWSSKRRPWKGGKDRMAVVKAFLLTSMPFVLAEAATGMASFLTGQLSMPPLVGAGTAVDMAILLAGILVAIPRIVRIEPSGTGEVI